MDALLSLPGLSDTPDSPESGITRQAALTATAATNGKRQRPATAHNTRTILRNLGYVRPEKQTVGISAVPPRLLPTLLPSRWTAPDARGQLWNIGPAYDR
jgi:hypothetical protein